ncbi:MAG: YncE family protein [Betaproteobacteria bacterium]|nr:YncE family protein [Betaproteobacteria bacterium]
MKSPLLFAATRILGTIAFVCLFTAGVGTAATPLPLKVAHPDIPLAGKPNRFDYESIDPQRRLLFIAHLGSGIVTVVDLNANSVVANIRGVPGVHGVLAVPSLDEVFATATDRNRLDVISEKNFQIIAHAPAGVYPDGMTYAPPQHKLFISDEAGQTETVVNTRTNKRVATIPMGGEVGNSQYDPVSRLVFVDVQTRDEIVAIDPRTDKIVHRYRLPEACNDDHSLLLDSSARLGFIACDVNAKLLVVDLSAMHVLSIHETGSSPDVLAFDTGLQRLYVASESGVIAVFHLEGNKLRLLGRSYLAHDAHSVAVDPKTHEVYFPLENIGGVGVLRIMKPIMNEPDPRRHGG